MLVGSRVVWSHRVHCNKEIFFLKACPKTTWNIHVAWQMVLALPLKRTNVFLFLVIISFRVHYYCDRISTALKSVFGFRFSESFAFTCAGLLGAYHYHRSPSADLGKVTLLDPKQLSGNSLVAGTQRNRSRASVNCQTRFFVHSHQSQVSL